MKAAVRLLSAASLVIFAALAFCPMRAGANTLISRSTFSGPQAAVHFETDSADGCVHRVTDVILTDARGTDTDYGRFNGAIADVYSGAIDTCRGGIPFSLSGEVVLSPDQFAFDSQLGAATLRATVPTKDATTGGVINIDVNLSWTASSDSAVLKYVQMQVLLDGTRSFTRFFGKQCDAFVSGGLSDGSTNFGPDPNDPFAGALADTKSGSWERRK